MDFNKFQEWCQNKGFVIKLPSGYVKLIKLDVSSFESFKGIFNLCMIFFYEELYKQRENEKEEALNNCIKNFKNSPTILYPADGSIITPLNDSESTVRSNRSIKIKKYRKDIDVKYSDEDFEKTFNYLLTPNENSGIVPMDRLLNYLENKEKYENSESATSVDGEAKRSKSNWCDIGKENREKEYKDSELKRLVDKVADKYDSEDSTAPWDVADSASSYDDADWKEVIMNFKQKLLNKLNLSSFEKKVIWLSKLC